jgi:small GTP-binding protein
MHTDYLQPMAHGLCLRSAHQQISSNSVASACACVHGVCTLAGVLFLVVLAERCCPPLHATASAMILQAPTAAAQLVSANLARLLRPYHQATLTLLRAVHTGTSEQQRVLTVALVGYPNAGKSELTNKLIGVKISGVSTKRNTTLEPRLGAFTSGHTQVVLYDTPGLVTRPEATNPLERLRSAWHVAASADLILYIVDADKQVTGRNWTIQGSCQQAGRICNSHSWRHMCKQGTQSSAAQLGSQPPRVAVCTHALQPHEQLLCTLLFGACSSSCVSGPCWT